MSLEPTLAAELSQSAFAMLTKGVSPIRAGLSVMGMLLGGGAFTALSVPAVARFVLPPPRDTRLADHLPFDRLLPDRRTLICRDGTLVQCVLVEGRDITFLSLAERDSLFRLRKNWLDSIAELGVTVRSLLLREQVALKRDDAFDNPLLTDMATAWNASFQTTYHHRQVIVLSTTGKGRAARTRLQEAVDATLHMLAPYHPRVMNGDTAGDDDLLAFWGFLASPISRPRATLSGPEVSEAIANDCVEFGGEQGLIRFRRGDQERYVAAIGVRRFGDYVDEQLLADLCGLDTELVVMNLIEPWGKAIAALKIAQEGRMSRVTRFSDAANGQYDSAMEIIEGLDENRASLANYSFVIFLINDSAEKIAVLDGEIRKIFAAYGAGSVREGVAAQASWFSQFPGYQPWPRSYRFFSSNIACNMTLDRSPPGLPKCDWGEGPLALFRTLGGTSYSFQLHVSAEKDAVAHAVCIGPTGSGKTTVMSFLAGMALRHQKLRAYIFDRYQGAYVFTNAVGGRYVSLTPGAEGLDQCGLNPFQCADTPENRSFLRLWLRAISGCEDADSLEEISLAVQSLFDSTIPVEERSLSVLYEPCFSAALPLKRELLKWVDPSAYGTMFNAPRDTLDMRSSRLVTFDMTDIFKDELLTQATLSYLMHRIQATIGEANAPAFIFIDETEPMLRNPQFRTYYLTMLQEYRKRGAAVISAFQRPEAIAQTGMSEAIRGQCQTMFFFPNPQAKPEDYADWSLTDSEWAYVKGDFPLSRKLCCRSTAPVGLILKRPIKLRNPHPRCSLPWLWAEVFRLRRSPMETMSRLRGRRRA
jgi:type IV secretion system protein VirB4